MKTGTLSEELRKSIHILMGGFALILRFLPWWAAAALAAGAVVSNATWIPRLGGGALMRSEEKDSLLRSGVWLYSLSILLLILIFPHRLELVAGAWGILAFGDGFATLLGRGIGGPRLPWNPRKSWVGPLASLVAGSAGGAGLWSWVSPSSVNPPPGFGRVLMTCWCAALGW